MAFWADEIARSYPPGTRHVIHDSKTPSGTVPISGLRGPVISDAIARAFRDADHDVRFVYGIDDMDPMDSQTLKGQEGLADAMGKPLCKISAPDGAEGDYASYHAGRFLRTFAKIGIRPDVPVIGAESVAASDDPASPFHRVYRMRDLYRRGLMDGEIRRVLERAALVRDVYREVAKVKRPEDWLPLQVVCESCGRIGTTYPRDFDGSTVSYECLEDRSALGRDDEVVQWAKGCGHRGRVSPFSGLSGALRVKLPWNLEWCAQWDLFGVTYEEAGKDLMTAGGSRDRSNALYRAVWEKEPPAGLFHEFLTLGGKKMSSSKGVGAAAHELAEIYPGWLARFLMLRTRPQTAIEFDPAGQSLPRLVDDWDRHADAHLSDPEGDLARVWRAAATDRQAPAGLRVRFGTLASWIQIPSIDADLAGEAARENGAPLGDDERSDLEERAALAREWLDRWAPDEARFSVARGALPEGAGALTADQRGYLRSLLAEMPAGRGWSDVAVDALHTRLQEMATATALAPKDAYAAIYLAFIGKPFGPRAAWLLKTLDQDFVRARLAEAAGS